MARHHFRPSSHAGSDRRRTPSLAAEVGPEDGVDPRRPPKSPKSSYGGKRIQKPISKPSRKALQLCGQVMRTLDQALAGLCDDDVLRCLYVERVEPAPDESRLLVTVTAHPSFGPVNPIEALSRLEQASGLLRSEVAADITRKRAPSLTFRFGVDPRTFANGPNSSQGQGQG